MRQRERERESIRIMGINRAIYVSIVFISLTDTHQAVLSCTQQSWRRQRAAVVAMAWVEGAAGQEEPPHAAPWDTRGVQTPAVMRPECATPVDPEGTLTVLSRPSLAGTPWRASRLALLSVSTFLLVQTLLLVIKAYQ